MRVLGEDVGTIDLYQLHVYDPEVPYEVHANLMAELIAEEKIRAWGVSNYSQEQLENLLKACDERGLIRPAATQPFYNILSINGARTVEHALGTGLVVLAHSPLLKSALTEARFAQITDFFTSRIVTGTEEEREAITLMEPTIERLQRLMEMTQAHGRNLSQLAIAWTLQNSNIVALTTPTNARYRAEALGSSEWQLESEFTEAIEEMREDQVGVELFSNNAHKIVRSIRGY
jgi:aryl-alcohol dehydrogenase-like predicted oxidoreductase